jgi:hypothetical protein
MRAKEKGKTERYIRLTYPILAIKDLGLVEKALLAELPQFDEKKEFLAPC